MNKPNFLLIQLDQLHSRALRAYGNSIEMPNIDRLFSLGTGFENCTCPFPLCQPSRASLWSGVLPHVTNVLSNGRKWKCEPVDKSLKTLGETLKEAGYETVHFGKTHDAGALRGFKCFEEGETKIPDESPEYPFNFDTYNDVFATEQAKEYFRTRNDERPLAAIIDLVNPHNICGYVGVFSNRHLKDEPGLPPLPPNFRFDDIENRSKSIQYICCAHNRQAQTSEWTEADYRHYLKAYMCYLKVADRMIGEILDEVKKAGLLENTYVFFFSDHGDGMAARRSVTKHTALYRELTEVPLLIAGPGVPKGVMVKGLAETLDIPPTILDLAGIKAPETFYGRSIKNELFSSEPVKKDYVVSSWHTEWGYTVEPCRMIRTEGWKYIHYLEDGKEELFDLENDPYEMKNVADRAENRNTLEGMRALFKEYLRKTNDPYFTLTPIADKRWRSHEIGYEHHRGPAAPMCD
jgi:Arylsulfatase A and related enzymes